MAHKLTVRQGGGTATVLDYTAQIPVYDVGGGKSIPMINGGGRFENGTASAGQFVVIDDAGEIPKADGTKRLSAHNQVTWSEDGPGYDAWLSRGRIVTKNIDGGDHGWGDSRTFKVTYNDSNHDLIGLTLTADWVRSAETDVQRVIALGTAFLNGSPRATTVITCGTAHLVPNTNTVTMPAKTYPAGTELTEILDDCARTAGKLYGVVLHHVSSASHECLQYIDEFDHSTYLSTLTITDDAPDTVTEFAPIWDQGDAAIEEGIDLVTGIVSRYGTGTASFVYVEDSADVASYDYWVLPYQDSASVTAAQASTRANAVRESLSKEHVTHQVTIKLPADKVDLLAAGMSINIRSARSMGGQYLHTTQTRRIAQLKWEPTAPEVGAVVGQYYAHMQLDRPLSVLAEKPQPVGPKPPSPGAAASCSLADEQMTAIASPEGDVSGTTNWSGGAAVSNVPHSLGPSGDPYYFQSGLGGVTIDYNGWTGLTFSAGVAYVFRFWFAGTATTAISVGLIGTDDETIDPAAIYPTESQNWNEYCVTWTPSADRTGVKLRVARSATGTTRVDDARAFTGATGDQPEDVGSTSDPGSNTGTYALADHVHAHGSLTDATDYHDADQVSIDDAGAHFTGTTVEAALQELGASAGITLSDDTPLVESGSGDEGTSGEASRSDHVHPADAGGGGGTSANITGAYDIEGDGSPTYTDAGLSDEFASGTLDAQWTAVGSGTPAAAAVNLLTVPVTNARYDLSSRSGALLCQFPGGGSFSLRADGMIANGESIIASVSIAPGNSTGNGLWAGIAFNDDNTSWSSGDSRSIFWDGADVDRLFQARGLGATQDGQRFGMSPAGGRFYFRAARSSNLVYFFGSSDGTTWVPTGIPTSDVTVLGLDNFWVFFQAVSGSWDASAPAPVCVIHWVRHVANTNFDPW